MRQVKKRKNKTRQKTGSKKLGRAHRHHATTPSNISPNEMTGFAQIKSASSAPLSSVVRVAVSFAGLARLFILIFQFIWVNGSVVFGLVFFRAFCFLLVEFSCFRNSVAWFLPSFYMNINAGQ
jgi:hypothetical protein